MLQGMQTQAFYNVTEIYQGNYCCIILYGMAIENFSKIVEGLPIGDRVTHNGKKSTLRSLDHSSYNI